MTTDARIVSLEHQVRTLRRMLFGVFGVVVVGGLLAATTLQKVPDVVQAKKFEVVDGTGKTVTILDDKLMLNTPGTMVGIVNGAFLVMNEKGQQLTQLSSNSPKNGTLGELVLFKANGEQYISLNHQDGQGMITAKNDDKKVVATLPSLNQRLVEACYETPPNPGKVNYLMDTGAGVNFKAHDHVSGSMTPLQIAISTLGNNTDTSVISMLLQNGADPNVMLTMSTGGKRIAWSPLMIVVGANSHPEVTRLLIKAGADVNAQGVNESMKPYTPLMAAAGSTFSSPEIVSELLKAGADAHVQTSRGETALDLARKNPAMKGTRVIEELEAAMKKN